MLNHFQCIHYRAKNAGYTGLNQLATGEVSKTVTSYNGRYSNKTYTEIQETLYDYDYSSFKVTQYVYEGKRFFMCKRS